jgi:predicted nucleic acid-binding protein
MSVLVDTNIILDILTDDKSWADWSIAQLDKYCSEGLVINPVVYAELCFGSPSAEFVDGIVREFRLNLQEIPRQGLFLAAKAFEQYKSRSGTKRSALPDFFIGGHAEASGLRLLTRDVKRVGSYFPNVRLLCP